MPDLAVNVAHYYCCTSLVVDELIEKPGKDSLTQ